MDGARRREEERGVDRRRVRDLRERRQLGVRRVHVDERRVDRQHRRCLAAVRVEARRRPEELARLVGRHAVPVVDREGARAGGQPVGGGRAGVGDRVRVVVVAVEEDDPPEADRRRATRTGPRSSAMNVGIRMWTTPVNPTCGYDRRVVDRRAPRARRPRGDAAGDLLSGRATSVRSGPCGPCCSVEPVGTITGLVRRAGTPRPRGRSSRPGTRSAGFICDGLLGSRQAMVVVSSPIPSIQAVTVVAGLRDADPARAAPRAAPACRSRSGRPAAARRAGSGTR